MSCDEDRAFEYVSENELVKTATQSAHKKLARRVTIAAIKTRDLIVLRNRRRKPSQQRGIQKYDQIIAATKKLVGQRGNDDVSIRDIAKQADVAPSSIYQYFDDKNDILIAIMEVYFDQTYEWLSQHTSSAKTLVEWVHAIESSLDFFITLLKDDPDWMTIWTGVQASPVLRDYDNEDAMRNAQLIQKQLRGFCPHISEEDALSVCVLLIQLVATTAKMSLLLDQRLADGLIREYKHLIRLRIRELSV